MKQEPHSARDEAPPFREGRVTDVELAEYGPTERKGALVIKTITNGSGGIFKGLELNWGYNGTGTSVAAYEVLADALGEPPTDELREAFCEDVPEYELPRSHDEPPALSSAHTLLRDLEEIIALDLACKLHEESLPCSACA